MVRKKQEEEFDYEHNPNIMAAGALLTKREMPIELREGWERFLSAVIAGENLSPVLSGFKKIQDGAIKDILSGYDIMATKGVDNRFYIRPLSGGTPIQGEETYRPIDKGDLEIMMTRIYEKISGQVDGQDINKIMTSLIKKIRATNQVEKIDNRFIQIFPQVLWDSETGDFVSSPPKGHYCARRLFDTRKGGSHVVKYDDEVWLDEDGYFDYKYDEMLKSYAEAAYENIMATNGSFDALEDFNFVMAWADDDIGVYRDIMLMYASMFMAKKPFGIWVLRGEARNGKSTAVGLLHTIFGTNNTTRIQLGDIGDWHKYLALANTLVNAADEADNKALTDEALIKTIADHGEIELSKMREQDQVQVEATFGLALCANSDLKLDGSGESNIAFIKRLRVIPFNRDFSEEDKKSTMRSFEEETYTPETVVKFIGTCMGYAKYYMSHDFPLSSSMEQQQSFLEENLVSYKLYVQKVKKYFGKFQTINIMYTDYKLLCHEYSYEACELQEFKGAFKKALEKKNNTSHTLGNKKVTAHKMSSGDTCFREDYVVPELKMSIGELHATGKSVVAELESYYAIRDLEQKEKTQTQSMFPIGDNDE